jgi:cyclopropane fatty-acyl-phospholipid synthase-like methyltransferase
MARELDMPDSYWKAFWINHARTAKSDNLQFQVLRTLNKKPVTGVQFIKILQYVTRKMKLSCNDVILDLGCGNGLFTTFFASKCKKIVGVDFAPELVAQINLEKYKNVSVYVDDVRTIDFEEQSFEKVFIYAGLQYLSYKETIQLFKNVKRWLKRKGIFFIGDIPDIKRRWNFFNSAEREKIYFDAIRNDKPIIGTWFDSSWLVKLGSYADFKDIEILRQPRSFPYAHYRFDAILKKS